MSKEKNEILSRFLENIELHSFSNLLYSTVIITFSVSKDTIHLQNLTKNENIYYQFIMMHFYTNSYLKS